MILLMYLHKIKIPPRRRRASTNAWLLHDAWLGVNRAALDRLALPPHEQYIHWRRSRAEARAAMMVQCASLSVVVIETPLREGQLSAPLKQLLGDQAITKVFYDDGKCHVRLCAACHSALLQLQPYTIVLK